MSLRLSVGMAFREERAFPYLLIIGHLKAPGVSSSPLSARPLL